MDDRRRNKRDLDDIALGSSDEEEDLRKDKRLVFLTKSVLNKIRSRPMVTGTQIACEIYQEYKEWLGVSKQLENSYVRIPREALFYFFLYSDVRLSYFGD